MPQLVPVWCASGPFTMKLRESVVLTYHAGPGLFPDEGIPEDLGQSAHPERNVITVPSQ